LALGRIHFPGDSDYFDVSSFDKYSLNNPAIYGNNLWEPYGNGGAAGLNRRIKKFHFSIIEASISADAGIGHYFNIKSQKFSVFANFQLYFCNIYILGKFKNTGDIFYNPFFSFGQKDLWHKDAKLYFPMNLSFGLAWHFKTNNNSKK
jgi:hypothetical protein